MAVSMQKRFQVLWQFGALSSVCLSAGCFNRTDPLDCCEALKSICWVSLQLEDMQKEGIREYSCWSLHLAEA